MKRSYTDLERLFPFYQGINLNRARLEDIIDNKMFINLDYTGESPGSQGTTIGRNLKITTIGTLRGRLYFRGFQITGPSISAGFLRAEWRLFLLDRSIIASWTGGIYGLIPPGYRNTDAVLTDLYNFSSNP